MIHLLELSPIWSLSPTTAREQIDMDCVETISSQIDQALYRLRLAKPNPGLWVGTTAATLATTLSSLETELVMLRQSLSW
jgi:hypothetical protein